MKYTTDEYKKMPTDQLAKEIETLVLESERQMPAHYTSKGDRTQTFLVDFDEIDPGDEYQMASGAWYWVDEYMKPEDNITEQQQLAMVKCAEDILIASYIVQKLGRIDAHEPVISSLISTNKNSWPEKLSIVNAFETQSAKNWFDYCKTYGVKVANGDYS